MAKLDRSFTTDISVVETGHRHFYQQVIKAPEQSQNTWWKIHFPPVSILAVPQLLAGQRDGGGLQVCCSHSSGYCLIFFLCFSGSFYQNICCEWEAKKKKKKMTGKGFCYTVYTICTFFRATEVRDGKAILSHWGWTFPRLLNHLPLWQMTSKETLCGNVSYCSPPMSFPFLGWSLPSPQLSQQKRTCACASAAPVKKLRHELRLLKWSQPPAVDLSGEKQAARERQSEEK